MCDHILVTLLKMRPHYSQSSRENATPVSGSSSLASSEEVPPYKLILWFKLQEFDIIFYVSIYGAIFATSNLLLGETI